MSGGEICRCPESKKPIKERRWGVTDYKCNHSAFNGYHWTPSDYSALVCLECRAIWRTKAAYVDDIQSVVLGDGGWWVYAYEGPMQNRSGREIMEVNQETQKEERVFVEIDNGDVSCENGEAIHQRVRGK